MRSPIGAGGALSRARHAWRIHLGEGFDGHEDVIGLLEGDSLPGLFSATAGREPERRALTIGRQSVSHGELDEHAARVGGWLAQHRIGRGDAVLVSAGNSVALVQAYLGVLRVGAVAVLANPSLTEPELARLVLDSRASAAFTGGSALARVNRVRSEHRVPRLIVGLDDVDGADAAIAETLQCPKPVGLSRVDPSDKAVLAYTSGTTGSAKGVALSHRNLISSIKAAMLAWRWQPEDLLLHALPLFHQHGLGGVHATLIAGSEAIVLERFDPVVLCATIASHKASVLFGVPAMYERLVSWAASSPKRLDLQSLRLVVSGSAPLSPALAHRARALFGEFPLERYGLTESGLDASNPYDGPRRPGTVGLPLPGVQLVIAAADGAPVPDGQDGEIVLRGPQVFSGYSGPDANDDAFLGDGWFRTGDIGRIDASDGYLSITGRIKELIITGGMNVYPKEIELALELDSAIAEAVVVGVASQRWGEEVVAVVVPTHPDRFDADRVLASVRERLSLYKCPKRVVVVQELPRNASGKLLRREIAEAAGERPDLRG
jgi:malonyl-CoA/methylmalonyl-CoA synthetase